MMQIDWWSWKCTRCDFKAIDARTVNNHQCIAEAIVDSHIKEHESTPSEPLAASSSPAPTCVNGHLWSSHDCSYRNGEWNWPCDCGRLSRDFPPDAIEVASSPAWEPMAYLPLRDAITAIVREAMGQHVVMVKGLPNRYGDRDTIQRTLAVKCSHEVRDELLLSLDSAVVNFFIRPLPPAPKEPT